MKGRAAALLLVLCCSGCPRWVKAIGSIATAVKDTCDAISGTPATFGPPPLACLTPPR